jgi:hypothetical protein
MTFAELNATQRDRPECGPTPPFTKIADYEAPSNWSYKAQLPRGGRMFVRVQRVFHPEGILLIFRCVAVIVQSTLRF